MKQSRISYKTALHKGVLTQLNSVQVLFSSKCQCSQINNITKLYSCKQQLSGPSASRG